MYKGRRLVRWQIFLLSYLKIHLQSKKLHTLFLKATNHDWLYQGFFLPCRTSLPSRSQNQIKTYKQLKKISLDQSKGWNIDFRLLCSYCSHFLCASSRKWKSSTCSCKQQGFILLSTSLQNCKSKRWFKRTSIKASTCSTISNNCVVS